MRDSEAGDKKRMNPAYEKFRNYIDSLVQMDIVELFRDERGEERVSVKVPLQSLLWQGLRLERTSAPRDASKIPGWIAGLLAKAAVKDKEPFFPEEDIRGIASVFRSLLCLTYNDDELSSSLKLLKATQGWRT